MRGVRWLIVSLAMCGIASGGYAQPALDSTSLLGVWIVQPKSTPGLLLSTVTFSEAKQGLIGVMKSANLLEAGWHYEVAKVEGDSFTLLATGGVDKIRVQGKFDGANRLTIMPAKDSGVAFDPIVMTRASQTDLAKLKSDIPSTLITHKIPLPRLHDLPANNLAQTPPMGWSSWNHFKEEIDDKAVREIADAMASSGLRDAGYVYVNIDDGWQGTRDKDGVLQPNSKFPDMKALSDYVHARGLKLGIYNSPGPISCAGYVGTHGYETKDAATFARWGVDFLKYDWCSASSIYKTQAEMQALYQKMGEALQATGRPIVYSLCQYGLFDVAKWGRKVGGNLWRTTTDIGDTWASISNIGFSQIGKTTESGPGGWNDPDMLEIGNGGMTLEEYRTHFSLWAMLSAPLILGNDVRHMTSDIRALLTNKEVIAIDQDPAGKPPRRVQQIGASEVWEKPLADGSTVVALINRGDAPMRVDVKWTELNASAPSSIRDLWEQREVAMKSDGYGASVPSHGTVLLRLVKAVPTVNLVFLGDSITQGWSQQQAPGMVATEWLRQHRSDLAIFQSNQGRAGHTTVDVLPATRSDFTEIEHAATQLQTAHPGRLVFSIMLGTNDSAEQGPLGAPVVPGNYRKNLTTIIDRLLEDYPGCQIVVHRPIWYSPNTYNTSRYLAAGLNRLQSYFPEIDAAIVEYGHTHPGQVFPGDTRAFDFFRDNYATYLFPEQGQQGTFYLHPNPEGAQILGRYWAEAIQNALGETRTVQR